MLEGTKKIVRLFVGVLKTLCIYYTNFDPRYLIFNYINKAITAHFWQLENQTKINSFSLDRNTLLGHVIYVLESQKDREANVNPIWSSKTHVNVINFDYVFMTVF